MGLLVRFFIGVGRDKLRALGMPPAFEVHFGVEVFRICGHLRVEIVIATAVQSYDTSVDLFSCGPIIYELTWKGIEKL